MKKTILKKLMAFGLTAIMAVSVLSGCGNGMKESKETGNDTVQESAVETKNSQQTSEVAGSETARPETEEDFFEHDSVLNDLGVEPYVNEDVTITIGLKQNANIENYDTNYYTTMLEDVTGVNIEFMLFPSGADGNQKLQMMVAGGETLPDIIMWGQSEAMAQEWGAEGYLIPLENYFAHCSIYAVEGYDRVKEASGLDILDYQTCADGHIWSFPQYIESTTNPTYNRVWAYGPWLEALNLEKPTTTEAFKEMLEAFKTQDPNGNGKADEIPMIGSQISAGGTSSYFWEYLMNAFTHSTASKDWLVSTDGQLSVSYTKEEWKEGVKYLNSLVAEGLIDPVSFTQDVSSFKQILNSSGDQIVGSYCELSPSFIASDHPSKQEWVLLEPLTGPEGYCSTGYRPDLPSDKAYITADCEHPEVAFRILDLMCREDFTITARWGKQGENWDYVEDIKDDTRFAEKDFTKTWMGYPAYFYEYNSIWGQIQNIHWSNEQVSFRTAEVASGYFACSLDPGKNADKWELSAHLAAYEEAAPKEPITKIKYADTDLQTEAEQIADELQTYVYEKLAMWCTGVTDVEAEWDSYLAELETLGVSRFLEIEQAGWNN